MARVPYSGAGFPTRPFLGLWQRQGQGQALTVH